MINKKIFLIISTLFVLTIFLSPNNFAFADQGVDGDVNAPSVASAKNSLVQCTTVDGETGCTWQEFLNTLNRVKNYGFQLVVVMSVIFIVYAGGLYLFSGENAGKRTQANAIMSNVVIGFFLAAAGWLIVSTVLKTLGVEDTNLAPSELIRK
jgi:hypothetical protein